MDVRGTYVVVTEEIDITGMTVSRGSRVWEVD